MIINNSDQVRCKDQKDTTLMLSAIKQAQIELIYKSRVYSIIVMALAAFFLYGFLNLRYDDPVLDIWIVLMLLVIVFVFYCVQRSARQKKTGQEKSLNTRQSLLVCTVLTAMAWGGAGLFLLPWIGTQGKVIIMILLMGVVAGSAIILSHHYKFAITFILLVMLPMMTGVFISDGIAGLDPILVNMLLSIYLVILLRITLVFHQNTDLRLHLEALLFDRDRELTLQCEQTEQASKAKSTFLANMSHEMRTPMHAILGFSDMGSSTVNTAPVDKLAAYFLRINESGRHLLKLLDSLLDISKLEAGQMTFDLVRHDLRSTIASVIEELGPILKDRSMTIEITCRTRDTVAVYDKDKIIQVIKNLLSNSIKFSSAGSKIVVELQDASLPVEHSEGDSIGQPAISVAVIDQGIGIPEEELDNIFDKFVQSSKARTMGDGTGLGLSICKEIIKYHDGIIQARNYDAGGAVLTFTIPRQHAADTQK